MGSICRFHWCLVWEICMWFLWQVALWDSIKECSTKETTTHWGQSTAACALHNLSVDDIRQADTSVQDLPDPGMYGYFRDADNRLCPRMMNQEPAAPELLNVLLCNCRDNLCNENCTCLASNQSCTVACSCEAQLPIEDIDEVCTNPLTLAVLYTRGGQYSIFLVIVTTDYF